MPFNDNDLAPRQPTQADAHGHAALLLVESLIHGLREQSVLSVGDAIDIVETAVEVQADLVEAADGAGHAMREAHGLLLAILDSLKQDGGRPDGYGHFGHGRPDEHGRPDGHDGQRR